MTTDYIIIGAGSAGSAITYRLAMAGHSVTLIEFGGTDAGPLIQMPAALSYPMNMARYDWGFQTEPEPHLGGRRLVTPRGKVMGGSSSINGMVYVRGHARDYDHWADSGAQGWSYADVLPYFQRMEHWHGEDDAGPDGDRAFRGKDGPLTALGAESFSYRTMGPLVVREELAARQPGDDDGDLKLVSTCHPQRVDRLVTALADIRVTIEAVPEDVVHHVGGGELVTDAEVGHAAADVLRRPLRDEPGIQSQRMDVPAAFDQLVQRVGRVLATRQQVEAVDVSAPAKQSVVNSR